MSDHQFLLGVDYALSFIELIDVPYIDRVTADIRGWAMELHARELEHEDDPTMMAIGNMGGARADT